MLRTYNERRFEVPAMESTSDEILGSVPIAGLGRETVAGLRDTLLRSDLVKFAKFIPSAEENERSFSGAVSFVETTRRKRGAETPPADGGPPVSPARSAVQSAAPPPDTARASMNAGAGTPLNQGGSAR